MANSSDIAQSDLAELLNVLGMGDHARPQSPHEVFQEALRVLRARVGKPAPDSTRTGAAETEDFATALVKAWEALPGGHHSTKVVEQWLCETMHPIVNRAREALAARPEAPSDAGWSFDMEAAPRDGTVILLWRKEWGEPSAAYWGLAPMADGAGIATKRHPWVFLDSTNGVNGYEDGGHGPMAWHPMLDAPAPPSDPAPSGQAEG